MASTGCSTLYKQSLVWLRVLCLVALSYCAAGTSAHAQAGGITLESFTGPAHGTWSHAVTLSIKLRNPGPSRAQNGHLDVLLKPRTGTVEQSRLLKSVKAEDVPAGQSVTVAVTCSLPSAPDPNGRQDGDFDLTLAYRPGTGDRVVLVPSHPIHIETRDERGRVNGRYKPRLYDLVGAEAAPGKPYPDWLVQTGIRNSRDDCCWGWFEPKDGQWEQSQFGPDSPTGSLILQARKYDMTTVLTLCNIPDWAQKKREDGRKLGPWGPPADPARWGAFVDKLVGYYSKAPYYQRDWQIWNEAGELDQSYCFWQGSYEQYIDQIHNPAAAAIRKHYVDYNVNGKEDPGERCRVVYGGFPSTDTGGGRYARVLDTHGCGALTDILDVHYMAMPWFESKERSGDVYSQWVVPGKAQGCWITETGWGMADRPEWTPKYYIGALEWALGHNWSDKDRYRVYFFAYYAAEENKGLFWINSLRKWPNGYSLKTLLDTFKGDIESVGSKRTITGTNGVQVSALLAGGLLLALPSSGSFTNDGESRISIALKPGEKVSSVTRIACVKGGRTPIPFQVRNGALEFTFAWKKSIKTVEPRNETEVQRGPKPTEAAADDPLTPLCYIEVECQRPMAAWLK